MHLQVPIFKFSNKAIKILLDYYKEITFRCLWGQNWAKRALTLMPRYCDLNAPVHGALIRSFCNFF